MVLKDELNFRPLRDSGSETETLTETDRTTERFISLILYINWFCALFWILCHFDLFYQKFPIFELLSWQRYVGNSIPGLFRRSCCLCCKVLHNLNVHDHLKLGKKKQRLWKYDLKKYYFRKSARDAEIAERAWQRHAAIFVIFFLFILITIVVMVISCSIMLYYIYRMVAV